MLVDEVTDLFLDQSYAYMLLVLGFILRELEGGVSVKWILRVWVEQ